MKKYNGIVFFDYDFTTIDAAAGVYTASPKTRESMEKLRQNGYLTMLCSGRSKRFLENDIDCFQGAITCNGAYTEVGGQIIRYEHIADDVVADIFKQYLPRPVSINLETQDITYVKYHCPDAYREFMDYLSLPDQWFTAWENKTTKEDITKMVLYYKDDQIPSDFKKRYEGILHVVKPFENDTIIDVTPKGITKGDAIRHLMDEFNIDRKDTYAFGDSDNDIEMLTTVGTAIVMENHSKQAGEAASMITESVKNEGITVGLERLRLI